MQSNPEKHTVRRVLQVPAAENRSFRSNSMASSSSRAHHISTRSSSPRPQHICTHSSSCNSRLVRGIGHEISIPGNGLRRHRADKEILRRALTPPAHRQSRRWWNFRPTPSRL
ncbi:hypothetical protein RHMOL_Rhmol06G0283200 [Rhododendron molle]|uniref:Uncharacterized protein n=1 Tax=Rhododendron molle TaxID=49168 RepID=A0ACC0NJ85_RHOML|nr:hypothetical protein RHMOL_Rhmol06G0283200 [Rhododendron molle]